MKILVINIRYGYVGGPERYLFNLKHLLESNNHQVIPFSIKYPLNEKTEYEKYFASPLSDDNSVYFKKQNWNIKSFFKTLERNFYSNEVERNLKRLIEDTKPDFAIVLLYLRKLSPAVLVALNEKKIPFLVRLSDYGMLCPSHNLFRENNICELCSNGNIFNSVKYKCVHGSYGASIVNYFATKYHQSKDHFNLINHFVSPSKFLIKKMIDSGWSSDKFSHLPTFAYIPENNDKEKITNQIIYSGRLEYIKGVHHLLEALKILFEKHKLKVNLKLAGNGDDVYISELKNYVSKNNLSGVEFMGDLKKNMLIKQYQESAISVIPSLCYDNMPNSALESLACGTPLIAPNHGCFPEIVSDMETGLLFEPANPNDLAEKIKILLENSESRNKMSLKSISLIKENFSAENHYAKLMSIISKVKAKETSGILSETK